MVDFSCTVGRLRQSSSGGYQPYASHNQAPTAVTSVSLNLQASAPWVIAAARKLERLGTLPQDWDSYGGLPLKAGAREITVRVLGWLQREDLPIPAVVLGSAGTVQLEWRCGGKELEVDLGDGREIDFVTIDSQGQIEEGQARTDDEEKIRTLTHWLRIR